MTIGMVIDGVPESVAIGLTLHTATVGVSAALVGSIFISAIPEAIRWESSLSFLGVGVQPPGASWGLLVAKGKEYLFQNPTVAIAPGVAILLTVMAFNFIGDGLRDALDPSMKD